MPTVYSANGDSPDSYFFAGAGAGAPPHPLVRALAAEVGLPEEVLNCIGCHAKEGEGAPKTLETILIHQADFATFDPDRDFASVNNYLGHVWNALFHIQETPAGLPGYLFQAFDLVKARGETLHCACVRLQQQIRRRQRVWPG